MRCVVGRTLKLGRKAPIDAALQQRDTDMHQSIKALGEPAGVGTKPRSSRIVGRSSSETAHALDDIANQLLRVAQRGAGIAIFHGRRLDALQAQLESGEQLADIVVELARDATALGLLRVGQPARQVLHHLRRLHGLGSLFTLAIEQLASTAARSRSVRSRMMVMVADQSFTRTWAQ